MADLIPKKIAHRSRATTFNPVLLLLFERNRSLLEALVRDKDWVGDPYLNRQAIGEMFQCVQGQVPGHPTDDTS